MSGKRRKLNYLLAMPRTVQRVGDGYSFPLGIAYVSAALKKAGFNVYALNLNHREGSISDIIKNEIEKNNIDVVATGALSFQYSTVRSVVEAAKRVNRNIVTIVGGGIITSDPETAMKALEYADYGVVGEGELTTCELCGALEGGGDLPEVGGIIYRDGNGYKITEKRKEIADIDSLSWPDYEGFEFQEFILSSPAASGMNKRNTAFMIASRSCPYRCTFCFHTIGNKYRQRSLDAFFEELDYMVSRYKIDFLCLADELLAHDFDRLKEICERMEKYNINWWAQFRVDKITPELMPLLKKAGCSIMSFGLESADNSVLKSMRKGTTVEQIERALKLVYDAGITLEGAFIFGDIEETWETANNTLNWWRDHSEYKINLNLITVFPGSYLYKYACEKGIIEDKVEFLRNGCPQINVSKLTKEEFSKLVRVIMEAPMTLAKVLSMVEVGDIDYESGRVDISGTCTVCQHRSTWDNIKMFSASFLPCKKCGQRYNVILPDELRANVDNNIKKLLEKRGKVAIWGINYHAADLFRNSEILRGENVYPVDISKTKREMDLYGKRIYSPDIIDSENIETVIISIPNYFSEIEGQIKSHHKNVAPPIDICSLVNPSFNFS